MFEAIRSLDHPVSLKSQGGRPLAAPSHPSSLYPLHAYHALPLAASLSRIPGASRVSRRAAVPAHPVSFARSESIHPILDNVCTLHHSPCFARCFLICILTRTQSPAGLVSRDRRPSAPHSPACAARSACMHHVALCSPCTLSTYFHSFHTPSPPGACNPTDLSRPSDGPSDVGVHTDSRWHAACGEYFSRERFALVFN